MDRDPLTIYIEFARVLVERDRRIYRETNMQGIAIKGLAEGVAAARKGIADARSSVAAIQVAGMSLKATTDDVTKALVQAEADIRFEASQLGNGGPTAEPSSAPPPPPSMAGEKQVIASSEVGKVENVIPLAPPAPAPNPAPQPTPQVSSFRPSSQN